MTLAQLIELKKADEVICDITYKINGQDQNGFDIHETVYVGRPTHFQVIYHDDSSKKAILKDLNYVAPTV